MNSNKNKTEKKEYDNSYQQLFMLGAGILGFWFYKNDVLVKTWLFDHLLMVILAVIGLLGAIGYYIYWKLKKRDEEFLLRSRQLEIVRTNQTQQDFYQRPNRRPSSNRTNYSNNQKGNMHE